jgi:phosphoserine aminotransferase
LDGLKWAESIGGLAALLGRSRSNLKAIEDWAERTDWVDFLAVEPMTRSNTSVCLKVVDPWFVALTAEEQAKVIKKMTGLLETEQVAYDIASYRDAPSGLRIWAGATVELADVEALLPWLDWAYAEVKG